MTELNDWLSQVMRTIKNDLEDEILDEYQKVTVLYAEIFHEAIIREWDSYLRSYQPKVYQRTGNTRAGIVVDPMPDIKADGTVVAKVDFLDDYMYQYDTNKETMRHVFIAMNDGWGDQSLTKGDPYYRYKGFEGIHILEKVEEEIRRLLPSYIKLEVKRNGE